MKMARRGDERPFEVRESGANTQQTGTKREERKEKGGLSKGQGHIEREREGVVKGENNDLSCAIHAKNSRKKTSHREKVGREGAKAKKGISSFATDRRGSKEKCIFFSLESSFSSFFSNNPV